MAAAAASPPQPNGPVRWSRQWFAWHGRRLGCAAGELGLLSMHGAARHGTARPRVARRRRRGACASRPQLLHLRTTRLETAASGHGGAARAAGRRLAARRPPRRFSTESAPSCVQRHERPMTSSPPLPQRQASTPSTAAADSATGSGVSRQRAGASPAVAITDAVIPSPLILHAPAGGGGERRKGAAGGPLQTAMAAAATTGADAGSAAFAGTSSLRRHLGAQLLQHMAALLTLKAIAALDIVFDNMLQICNSPDSSISLPFDKTIFVMEDVDAASSVVQRRTPPPPTHPAAADSSSSSNPGEHTTLPAAAGPQRSNDGEASDDQDKGDDENEEGGGDCGTGQQAGSLASGGSCRRKSQPWQPKSPS
ncbi:hypothetical protein PLESTF_000879400 [Pleodorina starrii]|nr:hypothetical protein PLESTF_000879400 [Pleodorina starrii]